jgi:hypothetical protein
MPDLLLAASQKSTSGDDGGDHFIYMKSGWGVPWQRSLLSKMILRDT